MTACDVIVRVYRGRILSKVATDCDGIKFHLFSRFFFDILQILSKRERAGPTPASVRIAK
jgi:hypothetical protein